MLEGYTFFRAAKLAELSKNYTIAYHFNRKCFEAFSGVIFPFLVITSFFRFTISDSFIRNLPIDAF